MNKKRIANVITYFFIIMLFSVNFLNAFTITTYPSSDFNTDILAMDRMFGISNYTIEDFEDVNLVSNLMIQVGDNESTNTLSQIYDPKEWGPSAWDGKYVLLNSTDNAWNWPQHNFRSRITFYIKGGATSFGIGLSNFQRGTTQNHPILINGKKYVDNVGNFNNYIDYQDKNSAKNLYIVIKANTGEMIESISFGYDGTHVDGLIFDHLAFNQNIPSSELYKGLIAYYPFNGNAKDISGIGNHGTVYNATLGTDRFGNLNEAYVFDGIDDYIEAFADENTHVTLTSFSISFWAKWEGSDHQMPVGIHKYNGDSIGYIYFNNNDFLVNFDGDSHYYPDNNSLIKNQWTLYTVTYDGNIIKLYVNTTEVSSAEKNYQIYNSYRFGWCYSTINYHFKGALDDIRVYNRQLNQSEIKALYNIGDFNLNDDIVAFYEFENNANDSCGGDNNGTENNIQYNDGASGYAANFIGNNSYIEVENENGINKLNLNFTISLFIKTNHDATKNNRYSEIILQKTRTSNKKYEFSLSQSKNDNNICFGVYNDLSDNEFLCTVNNSINDNVFHHIAITRDTNSKTVIFLDGQALAEKETSVSNIKSNDGKLYIGWSNQESNEEFFDGNIDSLQIFNRSLTKLEINSLYTNSHVDFYNSVDLDNGLIAHYEFEDNTDDSSDNAIHGSASGDLTYQNGVIGKSAYFDGTDDCINIGNENFFDIGSGNFTLTAWIKTQSNSMQHIIQRYSGEEHKDYYEMKLESNYKLNFRLKESQSTNNFDDNLTAIISNNNWHFLVCTKDQSTISLYIDGYLITSKENSINPATPNAATVIGKNNYNQSNYFHGNIDDLRIYNRVLSQSEINVLNLLGDSSIIENIKDQNSQTPENISLVDMDYMHQKYFAIGGKNIFTSHYGDQFIQFYQAEKNDIFHAIKCNIDCCLSVGENGLVVDIEETNAYKVQTNTNNHFLDVAGDGLYTFIAVGVQGTIIKFFSMLPQIIDLKTNADLTSIIYDDSLRKYYITTSDGYLFKSSDGKDWEKKYITSNCLTSLEINENIIVITCEDGTIFTSLDNGETFSQSNSSISDKLLSVQFFNDRFATVTANSLFTSEDGFTWLQDSYDFKNETIQNIFIDKYADNDKPSLVLMTDSGIHKFEKFNNIKAGETKKATLAGVTIEFEKSKIIFENGDIKEFLIEPDDTMHIFKDTQRIAKLTFTGLSDFKQYQETNSSLAISIFKKDQKYIEILGKNKLWYKAGNDFIPVSAGDFWLKDSKIHEKPLLHNLSDQGYNSINEDFETLVDYYKFETFDKLSEEKKNEVIHPQDYRSALKLILNTLQTLSFDMPITKNCLLLGNSKKFISPKTFTTPFFRWLYIDTQDGKIYLKDSIFFFIHKFFTQSVLDYATKSTTLPNGMPKLEFVVEGTKLKGKITNLNFTPGPFQILSTQSIIESNLIDDNSDDIIYINDALFSVKGKQSNFRKMNYNRKCSLGAKITKLKLTYNDIDGLQIISGEAGGEFKIPKFNISKNWSLENFTAYLGLVIREKDSQGDYVVTDEYPNELNEMIVVTSGGGTIRHRTKSYINQPSDLQIEGSIKLAFDKNSLDWDSPVDNQNLMEFKINAKNAVSFPKKGSFSVNGFGLGYKYNKKGSYWKGIVNFDLYKIKEKSINFSLFQGTAELSARLNLTSVGLGINTFETDLPGTNLYVDWTKQTSQISTNSLACVLVGDIPATMPVNCPSLSDCNNKKFDLKPVSTPVDNKDSVFTGFGAGGKISFNLKKRVDKSIYTIGEFSIEDIINGSFGFQIYAFKENDLSLNELAAHFFVKGEFTLPRVKKDWFFIPSILKGKPLGQICASIGNFKVTEEVSHTFSKSNVNLGTHLGFFTKVTIGENEYPLFIPLDKLVDDSGNQIFVTTTMKLKKTNIKRRSNLNIGDTIDSYFYVLDSESFVLIDLVSNDNSISLQTPSGDIITENSTNISNFKIDKEVHSFTDITIQTPQPGTYKLSYKHTGDENLTIFGANNFPKATMNMSTTSVEFSLSDADNDEIKYSLSILDNNFEFAHQLSEGILREAQTLYYDIDKIKELKHLDTGDYYIALFYSDELSPIQKLISDKTIKLEKEIIAPQNLKALVTNEYVNLFWDNDPSANEYHISLISNGEIIYEYKIEANTLQISDLLFGEYQVNVCGYDEDSNLKGQTSSTTFNVINNPSSAIPESVNNVRLEVSGGIAKIVWDNVDNADFYSISLSYGSNSIFKNVVTIKNNIEISSDYYGLVLTFSIAALNNSNNASEVNTKKIAIYTKQDDDSDGLSDMWEMRYFKNLYLNGNDDFDTDGLSNAQEYSILTNPSLVDTDNDNIKDSIDPHPTIKTDRNGNSIADDWEAVYHITDIMADDDGDGYTNYVEYWAGLNPSKFDDLTINIDKIITMDFFPIIKSNIEKFSIVRINQLVNIDLSNSFDINGDSLSYNWIINGKTIESDSSCLTLDTSKTGMYRVEVNIKDSNNSVYRKYSIFVTDGRNVSLYSGKEHDISFNKYTIHFPFASMKNESYVVAGEISKEHIPVKIMGREIVTDGIIYLYSEGYLLESPITIIPSIMDDEIIDPYIFNYSTSIWTNLNTKETFDPIFSKRINKIDQQYKITTKETGILLFARKPKNLELSSITTLDTMFRVYKVDLNVYMQENNLTSIEDINIIDNSILNVYKGKVNGLEELRIEVIKPGITELQIIALNSEGAKARYTYIIDVKRAKFTNDLVHVITLLKICSGVDPYYDLSELDFNNNSNIDLADAIYLLQKSVK